MLKNGLARKETTKVQLGQGIEIETISRNNDNQFSFCNADLRKNKMTASQRNRAGETSSRGKWQIQTIQTSVCICGRILFDWPLFPK
jgi:hypothetical protein